MIEQQQPQRVPLALLPGHLEYIAALLGRAPYAEVAPIIADIQQQMSPQEPRERPPLTAVSPAA
jgi:hypothetical protein